MKPWESIKRIFGNNEEGGVKGAWVALVFLIPIIICLAYAYLLPKFISDRTDQGTYGDMFGAVNTLFSGLAFAGIIYTIYQQGTELRLQRNELKLQRAEVAKTNIALDEQVKAANVQRFENTFFNMLELHNNIVKDICVTETKWSIQRRDGELNSLVPAKEHSGKDALKFLYNSLRQNYQRQEFQQEEYDVLVDREKIYSHLRILALTYEHAFENYQNKLQPYYKNLFNIIDTIDQNEWISEKEKFYYIRIIESQLSSDELLLIFYKQFINDGVGLYKLSKKYSLLENIDESKFGNANDLLLYEYLEN